MTPFLRTPRPILTVLFCLLIATVFVGAKPRRRAREEAGLEQKFGSVTIRVRQTIPSNSLSGELPSDQQVSMAAARFFQALRVLPDGFIMRSGIHFVTFLADLKLNGTPAGGVASGDTIWLRPDAPPHTIYHELFHVFDPANSDKQWTRLNAPEFIYTGSDFYAAKLPHSKEKKMTRNLAENRFDADFVSRYAMSNEHEDRAETFASMIAEGPLFMKRVARSAVLKRKMEYIIEVTGKRRWIDRAFWAARLQTAL